MLLYIGPGGGFALLVSFLTLLGSIILGTIALLAYPLRALRRRFLQKCPEGPAQFRRVIVLGMDGLDPVVLRSFLGRGELPSFRRLAKEGGFLDLGTTLPAVSPVAWASFQTGTNPGKHRIFDFVTRQVGSYAPRLASMEVHAPSRHLSLGPWQLPLSRPRTVLRRGARPFWEILGEYGVFGHVLNVPSTFPPRPYHGCLLAGMDVPDLLGTQGTFQIFGTKFSELLRPVGGHLRPARCLDSQLYEGTLLGPNSPVHSDGRTLELPWRLAVQSESEVLFDLGEERTHLTLGRWSDWIPVRFAAIPGIGVRGMCRALLRSLSPFELYISPLHIDPRRPVLPLSHPLLYSVHLARKVGRFPTLGTAEDHWALNHGFLTPEQFREEATDYHRQRVALFDEALSRTDRGLLTFVFDFPDRMQHVWFPSPQPDAENRSGFEDDSSPEAERVLLDVYRELDGHLGRVLESVGTETLVLVVSDHGFGPFRRTVDLNAWLLDRGFLVPDTSETAGSDPDTPFAGIDWKSSKAYALGMGGIYLNLREREPHGSVRPGEESEKVLSALVNQLTELTDPATGQKPIRTVYRTAERYRGPYSDEAPDLVVGFQRGFRVSWGSVIGRVGKQIFGENRYAWKNDHAFDPEVVPGVLLSNHPLVRDRAHLVDLAPTILHAFGVATPPHMDGSSLLERGGAA